MALFFCIINSKSGRHYTTTTNFFLTSLRISMGTQNRLKQSDLGKSLDPYSDPSEFGSEIQLGNQTRIITYTDPN